MKEDRLLFEKRSKNFFSAAFAGILVFHNSSSFAAGVVSLNLCTDQLLVLLAPQYVAALEPLARDPALSFVAASAARLPTVRADAEAVLALHPDLVLAGRTGAQTTVALLRARGLRVLQADEPQSFAQIGAETIQLAGVLGVRARGLALVDAMRRRLTALRPRGGSAVLWQAGGWTAGPGSLGDAVLRAAGLANVGTGGRMGIEMLLARPPGLLATETAPRFPSIATDLARHPALRTIAQRQIPPPLLICGGPFTVGAAELLAQ